MTRTYAKLIGLAATAALAAAGTAFAASPETGCSPGACPNGDTHSAAEPGHGRGWAGMRGAGHGPGFSADAIADGMLAALKSELRITSSQDAAWQPFAVQARALLQALHAQRTAVGATASAPERMAQRVTFAKQFAASLETLSVAVKDLYETLTPEQKAIADRRLAFGAMGGPGRMSGRR